jgi:hypothetical protein
LLKGNSFSRFLRGGLTTVVLLGGLIAIAVPAQAGQGASEWCSDNMGNPGRIEIPILTSPVTLGIEIGPPNGQGVIPQHVHICYSTTPTGSSGSELTGGNITVNPLNVGSNGVGVECIPDDNAQGVTVDCSGSTYPTYTVNPGGTNGGQVITVSIPFSICVGQCANDELNTTGLIVGTITQAPAGGATAAYRLSAVCVMVDGIPLTDCTNDVFGYTGATATGTSPTNISSQGPCVLEQCLPLFGTSYVGTTGNQLATIWLFGIPIPVYGQHTCIYQADAGTPCPY